MGGARARARRSGPRVRTESEEQRVFEHELLVPFMVAAKGGTERLKLSVDGKTRTIDVTIPRGIRDGARLRVRAGDDAPDVILRVKVGEHPLFRRTEARPSDDTGLDLYLELPLTIAEATLGANVTVPTLDGSVELTIPPGTASGRKLRLRGRGIEDAKGAKGDLYAVIRIVPPEGRALSDDEAATLRRIAERGPRPRGGSDWPGAS
jgi:curved DNA-binding protein